MDKTYTDADGLKWILSAYEYMENATPGHYKFYRAAVVILEGARWEFFQWGRIGTSPLSAQRLCQETRWDFGMKVDSKRREGYINAIEPESSKIAWTAIVSAIKGKMRGGGAPLWTYEHVREAHVGDARI